MNKKTKAILLGSVLLAATGTALAFGGPGNCDQRGGPMGAMGMGGGGPFGGQMQGFSQIENLTSEQKDQLTELRQTQRASMQAQHEAMTTQHAEMQKKVDAILTEEQREQLAAMQSSNFGHGPWGGRHQMGGHQGW